MTITVEPLTADNCLSAGTIDPDWSPSKIEDFLHRRAAIGRVAYDQGKVAGFVISWVVDGDVEIIQITTAKGHRRKGVATAMMKSLIHDYMATCCYLDVRADNTAAIHLYKRLGFQETGRRLGYYSRATVPESETSPEGMKHRIDAVLMRLDRKEAES